MKKLIFVIAIALFGASTFAQSAATRIKEFNLENKVAIQGYDPVAYFKQNKAVKGKKEITATYEGVTYYFAMQVDKDFFLKSPTSYEPQYGGWCSYAMGAKGEKVEVDPENYKIVNGSLNLFYKNFFSNTLDDWNKDETKLKKQADINWVKNFKWFSKPLIINQL